VNRRVRALVLRAGLVAMVAIAACSSGDVKSISDADRQKGSDFVASALSSASSSAGAAQNANQSSDAGVSSSSDGEAPVPEVQARPQGPDTSFIRTDFPVDVQLSNACLVAGTAQTITIDMNYQGAVAYMAVYSDGKNPYDPDYYGGNKGSKTDPQGVWQDTWVVGATAPAGRVDVTVVAIDGQNKQSQAKAAFTIADLNGNCP
jgi:hypothetical protein